MQSADWGAGQRMRLCVPPAVGARVARLWLCPVVTEWVTAGQQTAICKHHEGKHQSTLDFFYIIFFL